MIGAFVALTTALELILEAVLEALNVDVNSAPSTLVELLVYLAAYIGLVQFLTVRTGALTWRTWFGHGISPPAPTTGIQRCRARPGPRAGRQHSVRGAPASCASARDLSSRWPWCCRSDRLEPDVGRPAARARPEQRRLSTRPVRPTTRHRSTAHLHHRRRDRADRRGDLLSRLRDERLGRSISRNSAVIRGFLVLRLHPRDEHGHNRRGRLLAGRTLQLRRPSPRRIRPDVAVHAPPIDALFGDAACRYNGLITLISTRFPEPRGSV